MFDIRVVAVVSICIIRVLDRVHSAVIIIVNGFNGSESKPD